MTKNKLLTLRIGKEEADLISAFAKFHGLSVSELARQSMLEKIQRESDLYVLNQRIQKSTGQYITHTEILEDFGL